MKAKNENSLSACASARAYAREEAVGTKGGGEGDKKGERFLRKVHLFAERVRLFFSSVERL